MQTLNKIDRSEIQKLRTHIVSYNKIYRDDFTSKQTGFIYLTLPCDRGRKFVVPSVSIKD